MSELTNVAAKTMQQAGRRALGNPGLADAAKTMLRDDAARPTQPVKTFTPDALKTSTVAKAKPAAMLTPAKPGPAPTSVHGNVLITYLTVGNGHQKAAEAIEESIHRKYPAVKVSLVDLAACTTLGRWASKLFYPLINSGFYPKFYAAADHPVGTTGLLAKIGLWFTNLTTRGYMKVVEDAHPDAVISTHLLGAKLIGDGIERGELSSSLRNFQVVTDEYGHGTYVMPHLDGTFVPSPEVADQLTSKGLDRAHIGITGIPINPVFADQADKAGIKAGLHFDPQSRVLLVQGNLVNNIAQYKTLLGELQAKYPNGINGEPIEVAVACGNNAALETQLEGLASSYGDKLHVRPFGQLDAPHMRDLMLAADLSVTKPGGLTTAESVAEGLPMVLLDVMKGGQETHNADHFGAAGASVSTHDIGEATAQVVSLLGNDAKLKHMHDAAARIGKPNAAADIADITAATLPQN